MLSSCSSFLSPNLTWRDEEPALGPASAAIVSDRHEGNGVWSRANIALAEEEGPLLVPVGEVVGTPQFGGKGGPNITLTDEDPVPVLATEVVGTEGGCRGNRGGSG